jgi:hypothetical protein
LRISELEVACPPIPPSSTTSVRNPSETGADDDHVELAPLGVDRGAGGAGQLEIGRILEHGAVREHHQG